MNVLNNKTYTFSGHESFPCKTLWTKKGYDFVTAHKDFNSPNAVVDLGVGKNMVAAVRYWYKAFWVNKGTETSWIADYIFDEELTVYVDGKLVISKSKEENKKDRSRQR